MAITVDGKDMKDAVIKTDQFEMRILEFVPEHLRLAIKGISDEAFNFVPRFLVMMYPDRPLNAKDSGIVTVRPGKTIQAVIEFEERLRIERFLRIELHYARKKLATINIE